MIYTIIFSNLQRELKVLRGYGGDIEFVLGSHVDHLLRYIKSPWKREVVMLFSEAKGTDERSIIFPVLQPDLQ